MADKKIHVLSTRQLDDTLIEKAAEKNIDIDVISFINTQPVTNKVLQTKLTALESKKTIAVFTSAVAVAALFEKIRDPKGWKFYCLSGATLKMLQHFYPKAEIADTAEHALGLAHKIVQQKVKKVQFFCGDLHRAELPDYLHHHGVQLSQHIIYETVQQPVKTERDYDGVIFFSPSAGESYFKENTPSDDTVLFTIGQTTANSLTGRENKVVVSTAPKPDVLVNEIIEYYSESAN